MAERIASRKQAEKGGHQIARVVVLAFNPGQIGGVHDRQAKHNVGQAIEAALKYAFQQTFLDAHLLGCCQICLIAFDDLFLHAKRDDGSDGTQTFLGDLARGAIRFVLDYAVLFYVSDHAAERNDNERHDD